MKRNKKEQTCYMCTALSTSREHVPPACLFPEEKDIDTSIFRNNLLTVPSCDLHNSKKSKDDEFLMITMAGILGNNVIGYFHRFTKVKRALERRQTALVNNALQHGENIGITQPAAATIQVELNPPTYSRLQSCFEHIARGLYYSKFNTRFEGKVRVLLDFITYSNPNTEKIKLVCRKRFELETETPPFDGTNPEIFKYEFFEPDQWGLIAMRMAFYEGASVFVCFIKSNIEPPYFLATELIRAGIKTFVNFPDGSGFEFN